MFSSEEKKIIADEVEKLLLSFQHPEMPEKNVSFKLHINGKESWSWADIEPNWVFENQLPGVNPWNEHARTVMDYHTKGPKSE